MDRVIVTVQVPAYQKSFDMELPVSQKVGDLLDDIIQASCGLYAGADDPFPGIRAVLHAEQKLSGP